MIDRWKTALHEAAHAVSAIRLGGRCGGIVVFDAGGGVASICGIHPEYEAICTAAGPAGGTLADDYSCPNTTPFPGPASVDDLLSLPIATSDDGHLAASLMMSQVEQNFIGENDHRSIALWAIGGFESQPDRWAARVQECHNLAAAVVLRNAGAIVAVAKELFLRGSLCEREILGIIGE